MSSAPGMTAAELYKHIAGAFATEPAFEEALLADFDAAMAERFKIKLPKPAKLVRAGSGFRLSYDGQDYDLGDPHTAAKGELNDAELELVSAGTGSNYYESGSAPPAPNCPQPDAAKTTQAAIDAYN